MDGLRCIDDFTYRCLDAEHRNYFNTLYKGTTQVIVDLCQEGEYQTGERKNRKNMLLLIFIFFDQITCATRPACAAFSLATSAAPTTTSAGSCA